MRQESDHYVPSINAQVEADLVELHSILAKDLSAMVSGKHLFSERRQRNIMIKWKIRLEEFIETADVTRVTQHVPPNVNAGWWITRLVYSAFGVVRKLR
jgi:hypothetical protein